MNEPTLVYDSTLLKTSAVYQIEGCLYRFLWKDPYSTISAPKYVFRPINGQRRQKDLSINRRQLLSRVYEVPGMQVQSNATASESSVQLGLF
jgi:hypothetical protein